MSNKIINITFILPSLAAGGAERVMSFVAQNIDKSKFNPTLLITDFEKNSVYKTDKVKTLFLNKNRVLKAIPKLFKYVVTQKPDIVISAIGHLNTVMAYTSIFAPKTKFVSREVNILSKLASYGERSTLIGSFINKKRFNFFDKIVCQSLDMKDDMLSNYDIDASKLEVINNPITSQFFYDETARSKDSKIRFITVARLKKQKGHDRIIQALKQLDIPFMYTIIGNGPEKETIFNMISDANLSKNITYIESTTDVSKYLNQSDVYLQGSYIEGFPNVVIESCAVGTPVLAFNAPGGINEIIEDGKNGYIVEDEKDFITKIIEINTNYPFVHKDVSHCVMKKYGMEIIIKKYEDLFFDLMKPKDAIRKQKSHN